jgi:hypothetical protein
VVKAKNGLLTIGAQQQRFFSYSCRREKLLAEK